MRARLLPETRRIIDAARAEARRAGSMQVEAEHMLLALGGAAGGSAATVLEAAGCNRETLVEALALQETRALALAGVHVDDPPPVASAACEPGLGESARLALIRAFERARHERGRTIGTLHLLLAVLAADVGTVPLALDAINVDRAALAAAARAAAGTCAAREA